MVIAIATSAAGCMTASEASLREFERLLAANDSATAVLGEWCRSRGIANPAEIRAVQVGKPSDRVPAEFADLLQAGPDEVLRVRHVRLVCGETVLSEAQNIYVASRLPEAMNQTLETTDTPFGRVIAPLGFTRERLASHRGNDRQCPHGTVLTQRALLRLGDGRPVSVLLECYTGAILGPRPAS